MSLPTLAVVVQASDGVDLIACKSDQSCWYCGHLRTGDIVMVMGAESINDCNFRGTFVRVLTTRGDYLVRKRALYTEFEWLA